MFFLGPGSEPIGPAAPGPPGMEEVEGTATESPSIYPGARHRATLPRVIVMTALCWRSYYPSFTEEETGVRKGEGMCPKLPQPGSGRAEDELGSLGLKAIILALSPGGDET